MLYLSYTNRHGHFALQLTPVYFVFPQQRQNHLVKVALLTKALHNGTPCLFLSDILLLLIRSEHHLRHTFLESIMLTAHDEIVWIHVTDSLNDCICVFEVNVLFLLFYVFLILLADAAVCFSNFNWWSCMFISSWLSWMFLVNFSDGSVYRA